MRDPQRVALASQLMRLAQALEECEAQVAATLAIDAHAGMTRVRMSIEALARGLEKREVAAR